MATFTDRLLKAEFGLIYSEKTQAETQTWVKEMTVQYREPFKIFFKYSVLVEW